MNFDVSTITVKNLPARWKHNFDWMKEENIPFSELVDDTMQDIMEKIDELY